MKKTVVALCLTMVMSPLVFADAPVTDMSTPEQSSTEPTLQQKAQTMEKDVKQKAEVAGQDVTQKTHQVITQTEKSVKKWKAESATKSHKMIKAVQADLKELGYKVGQIDGMIGAKTKAAIRKFQADHHQTSDGQITQKLKNTLQKVKATLSGQSSNEQSSQ
ncbi:peptidoglycan-binding domain-containing protein [Celerinatantimonas yamalensis]|uniref:Peptidoglycan-binding domain-containing protein n=1 Tax=Celerinatantimonas yamalensis TaxID=559956 RepID=A0ABW9G7B7_9GAMM